MSNIGKTVAKMLEHLPASIPRLFALVVCLAVFAGASDAQSILGGPNPVLPHDRDASANWRMAGMLSVGGIPHRTIVCATVLPLGAGRDDTSSIESAISRCPSDQVVQLSAGTFTIAEGRYVLLDKTITLRGAGPGLTRLQRENGARLGTYFPGPEPSPIVVIGPQRWGADESATVLTASAVAGASSVEVASTAGLSVGQIVLLDEASGAGWQPDVLWPDRQIWAAPDYRVVWQKHDPYYKNVDDFDTQTFPYTPGSAGCWFSNCDRPTNEMHRISMISGNTVSFDSPITISYRTSHQAQLHKWMFRHTERAGIEDLTVANGDDGNIRFSWCAYCWASNIEDTLWLGAGIDINFSFRVQLEGVYVHDAAWPVNGGGGYAISLAWGSSEALIENCISLLANKLMVFRSAGTGSVVAYNYADDAYSNGQHHWVEVGLNASHMAGTHHVLFEGNYGFNIDSDQTHGNSIYLTFFRNYASGFRRPFRALDGSRIDDGKGCCRPLRSAGAHGYAYWFSFLGNVLGTSGHTTGWIYDAKGGPDVLPPPGIWMLGYMDIPPQGYDPHVADTAIRDGNFDYLTNRIHWAASDTARVLPDSLYLIRKPAFFSGYTWPWVDPTGLGQQLHMLPAKVRYDAGAPITQPAGRE